MTSWRDRFIDIQGGHSAHEPLTTSPHGMQVVVVVAYLRHRLIGENHVENYVKITM